MRVLKLAFFLALGANALRTDPAKGATLKTDKAPVAHKATLADVEALHAKLEKLAGALEGMVADKGGALMKAKIGPEMQMFVKELRAVLNSTKSVKDPVAAMKKLEDARASMSALTTDLTARQEALMKEGEEQKESLLLGVLMTKQKESMDKQLEVLRNDDFKDLDVAKFLLSKHSNTTALYMQAGDYMDKHQGKASTKLVLSSASIRAQAQARADALAASFEKRVESLQKVHDAKEKQHKKRMTELEAAIKKAGKKSQKALESMKKREERSFKKWSAMQKHDIDSMKLAVKAIKTGDMKALEKAKQSLEDSIKSLKSKNGGFLVLLDLGHKLMEKDCPYCAAQCVDKCHEEGKPYVTCLTQCADAGKN